MGDFNNKLNKNPMPLESMEARKTSFCEVAIGYDSDTAIDEALRCLSCKNAPCVSGCPVNVRIPDFIEKIKKLDFEGAYRVISQTSALPAVCGRVCPQEIQCEAKCVRGKKGDPVAIGRLERFVADWHNEHCSEKNDAIVFNGKSVAVIGSGPAGLTCAKDLRRFGYRVTVFEALHTEGGVLVYGIPEFRLPKSIVKNEIDNLKSIGVEFKTNIVIGKTLSVDELFEMGYSAVFIASGAGLPKFMGIAGESSNGVYSANEFLTRANLMGAYSKKSSTPIMNGGKVAVVGGGNVAMDAARVALRLGAEKVYVIYRRSEEELPARKEEVEHAKEEGIEFKLLCNPVEIVPYINDGDKYDPKNNYVKALRCVRMELGEPDAGGRRSPKVIEGSEFDISVDTVIMAIGTSPNPLITSSTNGIETNKYGGIIVEESTAATSKEAVYAGGDAVTGAATVISAMGAGKKAASAIHEYLKDK